jgi:hypothetical protein
MTISTVTGARASVGDPHLVDRGGGERMDRHRPALEGDPRPTFGEVQCIRDSEDTGFERERLSVRTVARDRLQRLGDDNRKLRLLVDALEQLAHLRFGQEEAPVLVVAPVDRHADVVKERREHDDHLGVVGGEAIVALRRRLHIVLHEQPQEPERDVRDDLDVHPRVVVDLEPEDRVDVRDVPPRLELRIGVHPLQETAKLPVAACRQAELHRLDASEGVSLASATTSVGGTSTTSSGSGCEPLRE